MGEIFIFELIFFVRFDDAMRRNIHYAKVATKTRIVENENKTHIRSNKVVSKKIAVKSRDVHKVSQ